MGYVWEGIGKSPIALVKEELTKKYLRFREVEGEYLNFDILVDTDDDQPDLTAGAFCRNNSLFFVVDLMIDCPDDVEILANVANIAYEIYCRDEPFHGRLLIKDGKTYYQLIHILGPSGGIDPAMASLLVDLVLKEVREVIDERYAME
jgi:hypothetical protein